MNWHWMNRGEHLFFMVGDREIPVMPDGELYLRFPIESDWEVTVDVGGGWLIFQYRGVEDTHCIVELEEVDEVGFFAFLEMLPMVAPTYQSIPGLVVLLKGESK